VLLRLVCHTGRMAMCGDHPLKRTPTGSSMALSWRAVVATPANPLADPARIPASMAKHSSHILDMARKGAEHRYAELKAEVAALVKHFPHLAARKGGQVLHGSAGLAKAAGDLLIVAAGGRKRRKLSAKARKAMSMAQKARWAKVKAGAKK
jgi:hypothetical protein